MRDVDLGIGVDRSQDGDHLADREGLRARGCDHAPTAPGVNHVVREHEPQGLDVRQQRLEALRVDDGRALHRDRQHLLDGRDQPLDVGRIERLVQRTALKSEARRRIGVDGHGHDAAALPFRQQRHHHERGELTVLVGDSQQRVGCRGELHLWPGVDADRLALLGVRQGHHTDDEHRSGRHDQQQGCDGAEHRPTRPTLGDRGHRDAP